MRKTFLVALGSNLGSGEKSPARTLAAALHALPSAGIGLLRVSRFFATPCFPAGVGPDYVNAAAELFFSGNAPALLERLHQIEAHFGRRRLERWGSRSLDLDLIAAGQEVIPSREEQAIWRNLPQEAQKQESPGKLILPHPRLQDRAFVLVPLCDIAPDWIDPVSGHSASQMLAALPQTLRDEPEALTS